MGNTLRSKGITKRRIARMAAICLSGGFMFQTTGCASGLLPIVLSFAESAALSFLFGGIAGP